MAARRCAAAFGKTMMNDNTHYCGTLIRTFVLDTDLVLVIEQADDSCFWTLSQIVSEIRISGPGVRTVDMSVLENRLGDEIWLTVHSGKVTLEGDFFEAYALGHCNISVHDRDYEIADIRQKFLTLSKAFKSTEELKGNLIQRFTVRQAALERYLSAQQHNLKLKQEFFAVKEPAKAKEIVARLEVIADVAKILKEN